MTVAFGKSIQMPALVAAAFFGHVEMASLLLHFGAEPFAMDGEGKSAFERAPNLATRAALTSLGAGRREKSPNERLLEAAEFGNAEACAAALDDRADPNIQDTRTETAGWTALMLAARAGSAAAVSLLITAGADLEAQDAEPEQNDAEVRRLVGIAGAQEAQRLGMKLRRSALHHAAAAGHVEVVRVLLDAGARPSPDALQASPLHLAAEAGHTLVLELLLDRGADPSAPGPEKCTPLELATAAGHSKAAEVLLARGPKKKPSAKVLLDAAMVADATLVSCMLDLGADPNASQRGRGPVLVVAASAARLVREGFVSRMERCPTDHVLVVVKLLLAAGADPNARDSSWSALEAAAVSGHAAVVEALLAAGARIDAKTLRAVKEHGQTAIAAMLSESQAARGDRKVATPRRPAGRSKPKNSAPPRKPGPTSALLDLAKAATAPRFQAALRVLAERIGKQPLPMPGLRGGFRVTVAKRKRPGVDVESLQRELLGRGCFLFADAVHPEGPEGLVALPTKDWHVAVERIGTAAPNYDLTTSDIIRFLQALEADHPFTLSVIGHDTLEGRFRPLPNPKAARELAKRMYKFCPDIVDQGTQTVSALARELQADGRLFLWWD
ncbi:MAG: ankyrin repeat domain-containing protein [Myxococcota bacterium]